MKDFFDVYPIMTRQDIDAEILGEAIKATFANRDTKYVENHPLFAEEFFTDTNRNLYWEGFLRRIKFGETLSFVAVGEFIRDRLQPYWEEFRL